MDIDRYTAQMQQKLIAKLLRENRQLKAKNRALEAEKSNYEEITLVLKRRKS